MPRLAVTAEIAWTTERQGWPNLRERLGAQASLWTGMGLDFYRDPAIPWAV
jgi:hypothetical protein